MKILAFVSLGLILLSCERSYHKQNIIFFEKVSKIQFPKDLNVLETYDNGEFMCCGAFTLTKENLTYFRNNAPFKSIRKPSEQNSYIYPYPNHLLKDSSNYFFPRSSIIQWYHCNNCPDITIYIDTIDLKMWCYASYPDYGGDFCCKDTIQSNDHP